MFRRRRAVAVGGAAPPGAVAALKLRAERKAGEMLAKMELRGGNRKSNNHDDCLKLSDLGIHKKESSRWQAEARVPEEKKVQPMNRHGHEPRPSPFVRLRSAAINLERIQTEAAGLPRHWGRDEVAAQLAGFVQMARAALQEIEGGL